MSALSDLQTYEIHSNGGRPYTVEVTPHLITVYENIFDEDAEDENEMWKQGDVILSFKYLSVFIGDNDLEDHDYAPKGEAVGNSILVRRYGGRYTYIGSNIYTFSPQQGDRIVSYYSPVGNSDVPYPYAIGQKNAYFMLDQKSVPIEHIDDSRDGYDQYYEIFMENEVENDCRSNFRNVKVIRDIM